MTPILVTGGAGYIGSHTARLLAKSGFLPITLDNLSTGHRSFVKWGPFVLADLRDPGAIGDVLTTYQPLAVVHLAAKAYVAESIQSPADYYATNVVGSLSLLDEMVRHRVRYIVFSSSCSVYGTPVRVPIPESEPCLPVNPYGETKLSVERALKWYSSAYSLRFAILRYFNAAGADVEAGLGELHQRQPRLIPSAIAAALTGRQLPVYGSAYPTSDGTAVRDYTDVRDLARAHVLALRHLLSGGENLTVNLGTGTGHSVLEVVHAVEQACGRRVHLEFRPPRRGDPPVLVADPSLAERVLGWRASYSLQETISSAYAWQRSRLRVES